MFKLDLKKIHAQSKHLIKAQEQKKLWPFLLRISRHYNYCNPSECHLISIGFLATGCDHEYFLHYWMITWNTDPSNDCSPMATEWASTNKWAFWYKGSTAGMHAVNNWLVESRGMRHVWPVVCQLLIWVSCIFSSGSEKRQRRELREVQNLCIFLFCNAAFLYGLQYWPSCQLVCWSTALLRTEISQELLNGLPWKVLQAFIVPTGWMLLVLVILVALPAGGQRFFYGFWGKI